MKISERMRDLLLKKPALFKGYTKFLSFATDAMVFSLDHFIRHSAVIRGVDLRDPWKETRECLEKNFDVMKDKEFFIPTYMEAVYDRLKDPAFSKEEFYKLTNLSNINDICKCNDCANKSPKRKVVKKVATNKTKKSVSKKATTKTAKGRARIRKDLIKAAESK